MATRLSSRRLTASPATRLTFWLSPAKCSAPGLAFDHSPSPSLIRPRTLPRSFFAILGVAAKLEHRRIKERTARGCADAKAKGVKFGRKPKLTPHQQREAQQRITGGETQRSVARSYNVSQAMISRLTIYR